MDERDYFEQFQALDDPEPFYLPWGHRLLNNYDGSVTSLETGERFYPPPDEPGREPRALFEATWQD